ncbi:MAG: hypothetical protein JSS40_08385 [Proteobacteria bacterium]|nr:hypothetical protein [Pseudomonadota bacterium]
MPGKSTYLARAVLNHMLRTATLSKTGTDYISLHTADPTDANLTATELSIGVGGYSRVGVSVADASWSSPATSGADEYVTNSNPITFGSPTADWAGGAAITHFGIYDASTGGNLLYSAPLGTSRTVLNGDNAPQFAAGALVIREN